ncbi:hypothetical protein ANTHONY_122 [Bacillus phage Anthony]|uniref:Lipoprotein n=1 Tax=Bacillus phage Anthony TaxID=2024253 RepID=A0A223LFT1_9CAUD|nr:hypothetical protein ANTHONY_122 [Bacillus phage Anthony]
MKKILMGATFTCLLLTGCATKKDEPKKPKEPYELIIKLHDGLGISTYTQKEVKKYRISNGQIFIELNNGEVIYSTMYTLKEKGEEQQ